MTDTPITPAVKPKTFTANPENRWYYRWRHMAAYVFLLVVLFDFIIMPVIYETSNAISIPDAVELSLKYDSPVAQSAVIQLLLNKKSWDPITLKGNGIFYICFGAILGAASWTRGAERIAYARNSIVTGQMTGGGFGGDPDLDPRIGGGIDNPDRVRN